MILAVLFANSEGNILVEQPDSLDFFTKLPSLFGWPGSFHKWKSHFESLFTLFTRCLEMSTSTLLAKMGMMNLHFCSSGRGDLCYNLSCKGCMWEATNRAPFSG
ncbi:uncharacterized protein [Gossypium hirsutum]|uniref:Uncharacterized protein isoform X2 n=1 Tax=Gossypium hirsutum TaxID=3635 RepID=A0ABM3AC46_GOSHI|nr:uncharacterized protein LOC107954924 isoform X2 [Gossypium hirsutum]